MTWVADTPYASGQAVDPATEETVQPNCTPITSWRFTLGTGIAGQKVTGPWGSLSVVSGAYPTDVTTLASVPERDDAGRPLAGREVAGATTIELTSAQADQSGRGSLWIQGGTDDGPRARGRARVRGRIRLRGTALRDRQCERRQRRVHRLPGRTPARLLLRLLRGAAADQRYDRRPQGGVDPGRRRPDVHVRGEHLLHGGPPLRPDGEEGRAGRGDVLPRGDAGGRPAVDGEGDRAGRVAAHGTGVHRRRQ